MSEWDQYNEPLARIYKEVKKALPYWKKARMLEDISDRMLNNDPEVRPELENLIQKMIEDIDGNT